ncbi:Flagellar protein FlgJ [peptidoglycan hydrolase] [hydrothermal vent metagenome]|uniref:Peptidoglycan hydrolase FlgJ n=1 Tax=hydrothermal vent metagenome TaxID=652676 RepID=A0A3B0YLQ3_9ZZZZ
MQASPAIYNDFQALGDLKKSAREQSPQAIKQVAKQFESLFVQMMLKSMRDTVPDNELFGSNAEKMYQDMYDKQLSLHIAEGRGIGLAKVIERQLGGALDNETIGRSPADYRAAPVRLKPTAGQTTQAAEENKVIVSKLQGAGVPALSLAQQKIQLENTDRKRSKQFGKQAQFIDAVLPHAQRAAEKLGVDVQVLIAQSALETGWGKYLPVKADGVSSHNFFGIKADERWQGERLEVVTREYRHGVMVQEKAAFRVYESPAQAFDDYAQFILQNPRYQQALEVGSDAKAYARELQQAGYATDPEYANKIDRIRNDEVLQSRDALKKLNKVPLT